MPSLVQSLPVIAATFAVLSHLPHAFGQIDISKFAAADIIRKDVAIIGGGATGAHAAVRLREDFKKSVVVVEKQTEMVGRQILRHLALLVFNLHVSSCQLTGSVTREAT
jgi:heterodisulfide reductase subunit A-like polyferredoxin